MKRLIKKCLTALTAVIIIFTLVGCDFSFIFAEEEVNDKSERRFMTTHFNSSIQDDRRLTVSNGTDIFYINGDCIYNLMDDQFILEADEPIAAMAASEHKLYVQYESGKAISCDIDTPHNIMAIGIVKGLAVDRENVFIYHIKDNVYCYTEDAPEEKVSLEEIVLSGVGYGDTTEKTRMFIGNFNDTVVVNPWVWIEETGELNPRLIYRVYCYGQPVFLIEPVTNDVCFCFNDVMYDVHGGYLESYRSNGEYEKTDDLVGVSAFESLTEKYIQDGIVYELLQEPNYSGYEWAVAECRFNFPQNQTVKDYIVAYDLQDMTARIVYETEDNSTRIIGYDNNTVYLLDVNSYEILAYDLDNDCSVTITQAPQEDSLTFEWCGGVLFIYHDTTTNLIDIVKA